MSLVQITEFLGKYSKKLTCDSMLFFASVFGIIVILLSVLTESCVLISKVRMLSISVSKNSILNGFSSAKEYTSKIPPLIEYCPALITKSTFSKLRCSSISSKKSIAISSLIFRVMVCFFSSFLLTTFSDKASE